MYQAKYADYNFNPKDMQAFVDNKNCASKWKLKSIICHQIEADTDNLTHLPLVPYIYIHASMNRSVLA